MTDKDLDGIPERIKKLEETLGLNKTEISEKTGINRSFYYKGSKGEQSISFDFLYRLCVTFNVSADWLIFGKGQMFRSDNELLSGIDSELEELYLQLVKRMLKMSLDNQIKIVKVIDATLDLIPDEEKKD